MAHRRIVGDVIIYLKFVLKVTHPFQKRRFRQILLNSASVMTASKKVQLSLIGSRECALHRAINEPCALLLSPPKGGSKREFLPARRYASAGISRHHVSVCVSVTRRYCIKTAKRRITQTTPCDSPGTLDF